MVLIVCVFFVIYFFSGAHKIHHSSHQQQARKIEPLLRALALHSTNPATMQVEHSLVKKKLLTIATSGKFATFTPEQLDATYLQLDDYLILHLDKLDAIELFQLFELQFYLCILTNHDIEAKNVLDRLTDQFGQNVKSQRIRLLQSIYWESQGEIKKAGDLLSQDPDELQLLRRLTTFARHEKTSATSEKYILNLNFYLNLQPADTVAWCELADEYAKLGHYEKAAHCLRQVVLLQPTAYPLFYKIGLMEYYRFLQLEKELKEENNKKDKLIELMKLLICARDNYMYLLEINDKYDKSWVALWSLVQKDFAFNLRLSKISENNKAVKEYLAQSVKLRPIVEKKLKELEVDVKSLE